MKNEVTVKADDITDPENPDTPKVPEGEDDVEDPVLQLHDLTIRYWFDQIGGEQAAPTVNRTEFHNTPYNVATPVILGYTADVERVTGVLTGNVEYDVVYTANDYTLTIYYVYQNGAYAAPTHEEILHVNDTFNVESPAIYGYRPSNWRIEGTMEARNMTFTVIYAPNTVTIDEYGVPLGLGTVEMNVGDCFE